MNIKHSGWFLLDSTVNTIVAYSEWSQPINLVLDCVPDTAITGIPKSIAILPQNINEKHFVMPRSPHATILDELAPAVITTEMQLKKKRCYYTTRAAEILCSHVRAAMLHHSSHYTFDSLIHNNISDELRSYELDRKNVFGYIDRYASILNIPLDEAYNELKLHEDSINIMLQKIQGLFWECKEYIRKNVIYDDVTLNTARNLIYEKFWINALA